uniref:Uncharacterized protein n=1 Tax=Knipowitschia caucasica TaxID=637954 RepID=A0AAV2LL64_KNICA
MGELGNKKKGKPDADERGNKGRQKNKQQRHEGWRGKKGSGKSTKPPKHIPRKTKGNERKNEGKNPKQDERATIKHRQISTPKRRGGEIAQPRQTEQPKRKTTRTAQWNQRTSHQHTKTKRRSYRRQPEKPQELRELGRGGVGGGWKKIGRNSRTNTRTPPHTSPRRPRGGEEG